jgi:glutathione synthase
MDPLDRIVVQGDSTYVTMRECSDRGYPCFQCTPDDLYAVDGRGHARAVPVRTTADTPYFHTDAAVDMDLGAFDVVWMRKDPPFDMAYIFATYLLDMAPPSVLVVNDPKGLKLFNEKLWAMQFAQFHPNTLLSSNASRIRAFVRAQSGRVVLKPWDGNGGRGVLVTRADDRNLNSMIELLTDNGRQHLVAQAFIDGADKGDKRILLFDGEPVGAVLRVPGEADWRGNLHVGAIAHATELDTADRRIVAALSAPMKKWGMVFVGIDVIGGYLTEINVTSPTGIREINDLTGGKLEADLVDCVEHRLGTKEQS